MTTNDRLITFLLDCIEGLKCENKAWENQGLAEQCSRQARTIDRYQRALNSITDPLDEGAFIGARLLVVQDVILERAQKIAFSKDDEI